MELNQDVVPVNLDEALNLLIESLSVEEIQEIKHPNSNPIRAHFSLGLAIRNDWSLWDKESKLVRWFYKMYGVGHADDISGFILLCLWDDINKRPRRIQDYVEKFWKH